MKGLATIHGIVVLCVVLIGAAVDARRAQAEKQLGTVFGIERGLAIDFRESAEQRQEQWRALLHGIAGSPEANKVEAVNRFFNRLPYADDRQAWQAEDYWCTPQEFLVKGSGDCEDYALAKYCTLVAAGVNDQDLYLSCVLLMPQKTKHMVLCYAPAGGGDALVLDNATASLLPLSERRDLIPIYNFNRDGAFLPRQGQGRGVPLGEKISLSKWSNFLAKVESEFPLRRGSEALLAGVAASRTHVSVSR